MTDTARKRAWRIVLDGAREAYVGFPESTVGGIPIDRLCPGCGLDRPVCALRLCSRRPYDDEEEDGDAVS